MSVFLDTIHQRWKDAHKRYMETTEALKAATAIQQAAAVENSNWQKAYEMEKAREDQEAAALAAKQAPAEITAAETVNVAEAVTLEIAEPAEISKTDMIRDLLRQHPGGMTPGDLWASVQKEITNRAYVYSVLKRLKDREQVRVRRGKYYYCGASLEQKEPQITVQ